MPTTNRRVSLHTVAQDLRPNVRAATQMPGGPAVVVELGGNALMLDVESANELAEALAAAVIELDWAAEAAEAVTA